MPDTRSQLREQVHAARDALWSSLGKLAPQVLAPVVNSAELGGPRWPALRQAFRLVRRHRGVLIASDGLSDPGDGKKASRTGLGLEIYAETRDKIGAPERSWLLGMVLQTSQLAAGHGGLGDLLDELGILSTEIDDMSLPRAFLGEQGRIGVMLNLLDRAQIPSQATLPSGKIRLVNAKLLHASELAFIVDKGERGRKEIARRIRAQGNILISSLRRKPVV